MAQVKIFGIKENLNPIKQQLSDVIHECVVEALKFPQDKRSHRFFPLDKENMIYPSGRTDAYTIIEITLITGRTTETRKQLIRLLFDKIQEKVGLRTKILKFAFMKAPPATGISRQHGDEVTLNYKIKV